MSKRVVRSNADQALAAAVQDRLIILGGRNSSTGSRAYEYAALDLICAADELAQLHGIDIRSVLPSSDEIIEDLRAAPEQRLARFGGEGVVKHRWVIYDFSDTAGVIAVVCAGSGRQSDLEGRQPWVQVLTKLVEEHEPALVYVKELHRLARVTWAAGPLMSLLQLLGSWLGSEKGVVRVADESSMMIFFELTFASQQATKFTPESRRGMELRTDDAMVAGRANVGFGHTLPAGLARVRMRASRGKPPSMIYLDGPQFRPGFKEVVSGLSEALDADGQPADQVAAVQHLLATAYLDRDWRPMDGVRALRARGFSTDMLRQLNGLDATARDATDSSVLGSINSILDRLEFYESGVLAAPLGISGIDDIVLTGCMPPGGWARPEDFVRIRRERGKRKSRRHFRFTLTGLPVHFDEEACVLRARPAAWEKDAVDDRPMYHLQPRDPEIRRKRARIPHEEFAKFYADGISRAFETALRLFNTESVSSPELRRLHAVRSDLQRQQSGLLADAEQLLNRIAETSGAASRALEERYNNEVDPKLEAAKAELEIVDAKASIERNRMASDAKPVAADQLLHLVGELGDASSGDFRTLLLESTRDVRYERERTVVRGAVRVDHRLTGVLRVGAGEDVVDIPLEHWWAEGSLTEADDRAAELLAEIRAGVPLCAANVRNRPVAVRALADLLGVPSESLLLKRIRDGRISRAVLEIVLQRDGRSPAMLAEALDEPAEFVERIIEVYADPPPRWVLGSARYLTALYASAAHNDGLAKLSDIAAWAGDKRARLSIVVRAHGGDLELVYGVGYRVPPCTFCSCQRLLPMRIAEPVGVVCSQCRRDRRGLVWPADPYDRYLADPGVWALADQQGPVTAGIGRDGPQSMW